MVALKYWHLAGVTKGVSKRFSPAGNRCATIPPLKSIRALHDASAGWSSGLTIQTSQDESGVGNFNFDCKSGHLNCVGCLDEDLDSGVGKLFMMKVIY